MCVYVSVSVCVCGAVVAIVSSVRLAVLNLITHWNLQKRFFLNADIQAHSQSLRLNGSGADSGHRDFEVALSGPAN